MINKLAELLRAAIDTAADDIVKLHLDHKVDEATFKAGKLKGFAECLNTIKELEDERRKELDTVSDNKDSTKKAKPGPKSRAPRKRARNVKKTHSEPTPTVIEAEKTILK